MFQRKAVLRCGRVQQDSGHGSSQHVSLVRGVCGFGGASRPPPGLLSVCSARCAVCPEGNPRGDEDEEVPQLHSVLHRPGPLPRRGEGTSRENVPGV